MKRILEMLFSTGGGKTFKVTLEDPRQDITPMEIEEAMDVVIAANPFDVEGGLTAALGANLVTTETQVIEFV